MTTGSERVLKGGRRRRGGGRLSAEHSRLKLHCTGKFMDFTLCTHNLNDQFGFLVRLTVKRSGLLRVDSFSGEVGDTFNSKGLLYFCDLV